MKVYNELFIKLVAKYYTYVYIVLLLWGLFRFSKNSIECQSQLNHYLGKIFGLLLHTGINIWLWVFKGGKHNIKSITLLKHQNKCVQNTFTLTLEALKSYLWIVLSISTILLKGCYNRNDTLCHQYNIRTTKQ